MEQSNESKRPKARWSRAEDVREVEAEAKSGQTEQTWCAQRGVTLSRLHDWRTVLRGEARGASSCPLGWGITGAQGVPGLSGT